MIKNTCLDKVEVNIGIQLSISFNLLLCCYKYVEVPFFIDGTIQITWEFCIHLHS